MSNTYKLVKAEDGTVWVPLQPLLNDINTNLDLMMKISITDMTKEQVENLNFGVLGLRQVNAFIAALLTEQQLSEIGEKNETVH